MEAQLRPEELDYADGVYLVRLARRAVEEYLRTGQRLKPSDAPEKLRRPGAAFVTIETFYSYERRELRGCIGYIHPVKSLAETVAEVAVEAAVADPRFPPLSLDELPRVTFEVTVLGPMEPLSSDPKKRVEEVKIGVHGLLARSGLLQGLLLPQVPVEYGWDAETFLAETCVKAGMPPHCWLDSLVEFYRFTARLWREKEPGGEVEERNLLEELKRMGLA